MKPLTKHLFLIATVLPCICFAEVYKWIDENGQTHYGDSPKKEYNAKKVTTKINSYKSISYEKIRPDTTRNLTTHNAFQKEVTMYGTSWCRYCKAARTYFQQNGIQYTDYDIEKDTNARSEYNEIGGKGVPVILVGTRRMNGFSPQGFERIYKQP